MAIQLSAIVFLAMVASAASFVSPHSAGRQQEVVRMAARPSKKSTKTKTKTKTKTSPSAQSLFGGAFTSKPAETPSTGLKFPKLPFTSKPAETPSAGLKLPKLPVIDGSDLDDSFNDYAKLPALPKAITGRVPKIGVNDKIQKIVPAKNPRQDIVNKARDFDVIGKATGLDFAGLLDWSSRAEFIKKGLVLAIGGGSVGGLGLQVYLGVTEKERAEAAVKAEKAAAERKKADEEAKKKAASEAAASKAAAEKKKADDEKAAKKKAEDDKKKAEADEKERLRVEAEKAASSARQVVIDEANRKRAFTTKDRIEGSKARRRQLFQQYNIDDTATGSKYLEKNGFR